jgi:hypothetical protein
MSDGYRTAFLKGRDFTPMPSAEEQRRRHAAQEKALQLAAEKAVANRSRLDVASKPTERRGVGRDKLFAALRHDLPRSKNER